MVPLSNTAPPEEPDAGPLETLRRHRWTIAAFLCWATVFVLFVGQVLVGRAVTGNAGGSSGDVWLRDLYLHTGGYLYAPLLILGIVFGVKAFLKREDPKDAAGGAIVANTLTLIPAGVLWLSLAFGE